MKVKCFELDCKKTKNASITEGVNVGALEEKINKFLAENPAVKVKDLRMTGFASPISDFLTQFTTVAILLYEE